MSAWAGCNRGCDLQDFCMWLYITHQPAPARPPVLLLKSRKGGRMTSRFLSETALESLDLCSCATALASDAVIEILSLPRLPFLGILFLCTMKTHSPHRVPQILQHWSTQVHVHICQNLTAVSISLGQFNHFLHTGKVWKSALATHADISM